MANLSPLSGSPSSIHSITSFTPITAPTIPTIPKQKMNNTTTTTTTTTKTTKSKPRKRVNTAEKRSQHNAIERARRETLNGKFLSLARLLPSLASSRRPSKSAIVNGSISHLNQSREQRLLAVKLIKEVMFERDELLKEVNDWRKLNGYSPKEMQNDHVDEIEQISSVEKESFGNFSTMGGENDNDNEDQDQDQDQDQEEELDQKPSLLNDVLDSSILNTTNAFTQVNGLYTPRSSADLDLALQQNMFNSTPVIDQRAQSTSSNVNGINWSAEFALNLNQSMGTTGSLTTNGSITFGETHSSPQTIVSPSSDLSNMYQHTPSPGGSSNSPIAQVPIQAQVQNNVNVNLSTGGMPQGWNSQQIAMLQQHAVQANHAMRLHQSQQQVQAQQQLFNPILGNSFNAMFQPTQAGLITPSPLGGGAGAVDDSFTRQMLNNMFPRQNEVSLEDIHNALRAGMGVGYDLVNNTNNWTQARA